MKRLVLVAVSLAAALCLCEAAMQVADFPPGDDRILFWSTPLFRTDASGAATYTPHTIVRQAAIYGGHVEYDVRYHINNLGLVDEEDYVGSTAPRRIALVGDSFVEGVHAGTPWVPVLRRRWLERGVEVYNLGISATGIVQFQKLLESVSQSVRFNEIAVVAISNDFYRDAWFPLVSGAEIRLCRSDASVSRCQASAPLAYVAQADDDVLALAGTRGYRGPHLKLKHLATVLWNRELFRIRNRTLVGRSMAALSAIRAAFPSVPITVVHVPEKEEARSGAYSLRIEADVKQRGLEYLPVLGRCRWSPDFYLPNDNHPNARGYAALAACVEAELLAR